MACIFRILGGLIALSVELWKKACKTNKFPVRRRASSRARPAVEDDAFASGQIWTDTGSSVLHATRRARRGHAPCDGCQERPCRPGGRACVDDEGSRSAPQL